MNLKLITYLAITSGYINCSHRSMATTAAATAAATATTAATSSPLIRSNSAPDLRALCNTTLYLSASASGATLLVPELVKDNNKIIPYSKYKSLVFNRYKRNIYLRSKEKYTFAEK